MEEGRPSLTAVGCAMHCAAHLLWDDYPKIFEDTLAMAFSGCSDEQTLRERLNALSAETAAKFGSELAQSSVRNTRAVAVVRNRYVEDELDLALERGVTQYVILGAGLDSFAYRRADLANTLRVFEVDHPATQAWKRIRLTESGVPTPSNLVFVPLDFERQSLIESLEKSGYRSNTAGFFSWLGVTMYLTPGAIFGTLRTVASMLQGTQIIFEYAATDELLDDESRRSLEVTRNICAARGEPWLSFFEPSHLADKMRKLKFAEVWDFGPAEANARYCANRSDGLRLHSPHFMGARV